MGPFLKWCMAADNERITYLFGLVHSGCRIRGWGPPRNGVQKVEDKRMGAVLGLVHGVRRMAEWGFS